MALVVKDRVKETTTTTGTGTITLDGAATGFQSFSVIGNANTTYYAIVGGSQWEVGIGTYTSSGTTLSRDTVLESSTGGAKIDFAAGTKDVFVTYPAEKSVYTDGSDNVTLPANLSVNGTTTLGDASGDSVTFNAATVSTPNGLNFDSNTLVIDATNNRVGIGASPGDQKFQVFDATSARSWVIGNAETNFVAARYSTDANAATLAFRKGRGTYASQTTIASGDTIGNILFQGYGGTNNRNLTEIRGFVDTYTSDSNISAYMTFSTSPSGSATATERMRISASGSVGIGTTSPTAVLDIYNASNSNVRIQGDSNVNATLGRASADAFGPSTVIRKSRGTVASPAAVSSGDVCGTIVCQGYGGTVYSTVAQIAGVVETYTADNNMSGYLQFNTSPGGVGAIPLDRMRITAAGLVGIGTTAPSVALDVVGAIEAQNALTQDAVKLQGRAGGTSSYAVTLTPATLSASRTVTLPNADTTVPVATQVLTFSGPTAARTYTLPDANSTLAALGTAQTFTAVQTLTNPAIIGAITEDVFTITDGAAFEVDPGNGSIQLITLGASRTPKATNFVAGESVTLMINDGTAYTITWTDATWGSGGVVWVGGTAPTLATTGYTVIEFWKVSTQVYGALVGSVA